MKTAYIPLFLGIITIVILSCSVVPTPEPPGVGEKAEKGYASSEPVITALEQYRADKGQIKAPIPKYSRS